MSNKLLRKALVAVSSFNGAIYPGGHKTGVFFVEALHPYEVLTAAGFEVELASETGTCGFDDVSLTPPFLSGSDHAILNNPKHPFMVKINHNELLTYPNKFDQIMFAHVRQAADMGCAAVGATVYFGSDESGRQIQEVSTAFQAAHELGMATVLWCYLRNNADRKPS